MFFTTFSYLVRKNKQTDQDKFWNTLSEIVDKKYDLTEDMANGKIYKIM